MYTPKGYTPDFNVKILNYDDLKKYMCECLTEKAKEYHMQIVEQCSCEENPYQSFIECKVVMKAPNKGVYADVIQWYGMCKGKAIEYTYVAKPGNPIVALSGRFYMWELLVM